MSQVDGESTRKTDHHIFFSAFLVGADSPREKKIVGTFPEHILAGDGVTKGTPHVRSPHGDVFDLDSHKELKKLKKIIIISNSHYVFGTDLALQRHDSGPP